MDWLTFEPQFILTTERLIAALVFFVGSAFALYRHKRKVWIEQLNDPQDLPEWKAKLSDSPGSERYYIMIEEGLEVLDKIYGVKPFGWQAMVMCWFIALLYPLILFTVTWAVGGPSTLGNIELLPDDWDSAARWISILGYCVYIYFLITVVTNRKNIAIWLNRLILKWSDFFPKRGPTVIRRTILLLLFFGFSIGPLFLISDDVNITVGTSVIIAFVGAFIIAGTVTRVFTVASAIAAIFSFAGALAGAVAFNIVGAVGITLSGAYALPGAFALAVAIGFTFRTAGTFSLLIALSVAVTGNIMIPMILDGWVGFFQAEYISVIIFFLLLPFLNGLLDFASYGISRLLGHRLLLNRDSYHAIILAIIDLVCAVVLLAGLVFVLALTIEGLNLLAINKVGSEVFSLTEQIQSMRQDPFGSGLWITVMLFSTLIPTFTHFCIASISFVLVKTRLASRQKWALEIQKVIVKEKQWLSTKESGDIAHYWFFHRHLYPILIAVLAAGFVSWGVVEIHLTDSLLSVVDIAIRLIHGV